MNVLSPAIRVMLVDEQPIVLWGLEKLLDDAGSRLQVVGKANNGSDARRLVRELRPDILLMDLNLDGGKGADLVPAIVKDGQTRVVIYTSQRDLDTIDRAVFSGARGLVRKEEAPQVLISAILKVHDGELWLDRRTTSRIFHEFARAGGRVPVDAAAQKIESLTPKEHRIVALFSAMPGAQNKQIADVLCMSEHTLRNHLTSIFGKLQIKNRFDLFTFARSYRGRLDAASALPETSTLE